AAQGRAYRGRLREARRFEEDRREARLGDGEQAGRRREGPLGAEEEVDREVIREEDGGDEESDDEARGEEVDEQAHVVEPIGCGEEGGAHACAQQAVTTRGSPRPEGIGRDAIARRLLAIDLINPFDFPGSAALLRQARGVLPNIRRVLRRAREARVPVIYCNDNFGQWRSDFRSNVDLCTGDGAYGAEFVREVVPSPLDYFVLKPKRSAFFETPLRILLNQLGIKRLVLVGMAADACVLNTALDAHAREYEVVVVRDAVASRTRARTRRALELVRADRPVRVIAVRAALRWIGA
ncbi:MAG TPA: isochorismatase family cysteine hydrolase, partial [Dokdonella sp.]|nr:isochorismatase family cysteine hydrolase [Dokdonella sp.]